MTPDDLEAMILVCERHRVFACEVTSKGSVKLQFYPTQYEAPVPAPVEEAVKREPPTPEEVQAALHLGGGRG